MLVFFCILPLANALLDWFSWGFSRWLGKEIKTLYTHKEKSSPIWGLLWHAAWDFIIAVVLMIVMAFTLVLVLEGANIIARYYGFFTILDIEDTLVALEDAPFGEHAWVTAMLLTTLLPTAGHLLMVTFAIVVLLPDIFNFRTNAHQKLLFFHSSMKERQVLADLNLAAIYLSSFWVISLACLSGLGWLIWITGSTVIGPAATQVWKIAYKSMLWYKSFYL